jgi:uncharacterized membrane protein
MPRWFRNPSTAIPETARKNLESIAQIEKDFDRRLSAPNRLSAAITRVASSFPFILAHAFLIAGWIALNSLGALGVRPFDPFPFSFLNLVLVVEAFFLSTFILMTQHWEIRRADHWAHLHLQIGILAEQEATKMLQLLRGLCDRVGMDKAAQDRELREMIETTEVQVLAEELKRVRATEENRPR